ncbi:hypothetical protein PPM_p0026 (plasmid) [Paenibacillus polymyxa M1]|nr:hypothetical protein PPM_p0026 [Paenibacillus polymyxa M1]
MMLRKVDAVKQAINHDYSDPKTSAAILEGHEKRFEIFTDREKEFWAAFRKHFVVDEPNATKHFCKVLSLFGCWIDAILIGSQQVLSSFLTLCSDILLDHVYRCSTISSRQ